MNANRDSLTEAIAFLALSEEELTSAAIVIRYSSFANDNDQ